MVTDCFTASNTFKCSLHKNAGNGKAAGYVIAPSRVSFSVLPVAALSGAVRYLRRSAPAAAVSLPPGVACAAETVRHTLFLTVRIPVSMLSGQWVFRPVFLSEYGGRHKTAVTPHRVMFQISPSVS